MNKRLWLPIILSAVSTMSMAAEQKNWPFPGEVTGNIAAVSSYNFRGMTNSPENDQAALQAGIDYTHPTGFYLGYWGSTLGYSLTKFDAVAEQYRGRDSFENDFILGYKGQINEDLSYTVGGAYYYYYESDVKSNYFETLIGLNYKDFGLSTSTTTQNNTAGNKGDTYFLATYTHELPKNFTANVALGAYYYANDDKYVKTTEDFNFRHLTLGLSHPLGGTGANMNIDFIVGGYDRLDEKQKNKVAFGLKYAF